MRSQLISTLETLGYPVFLQGSLTDTAAYPESFFTFWDFEASEESHYNGNPIACTWGFWVNFYSTSPELVESVPLAAKTLLKSKGWILKGKPVSASSDISTHTGSRLECYYLENYK